VLIELYKVTYATKNLRGGSIDPPLGKARVKVEKYIIILFAVVF